MSNARSQYLPYKLLAALLATLGLANAARALDDGAPSSAFSGFGTRGVAQIKIHWSKIIFTGRGTPPTALPDSMAVKRRVAEDPHAIGYIDQSQVDDSVRVLLSP